MGTEARSSLAGRWGVILACVLAALAPARGQEAEEQRFDEASLRYRTALHYDPLLDPPLDALVKLYLGAERTEELVALYRSHIAQYPEDAGAMTVLVRILRRVDRPKGDELIASAVTLHPDYAPLQFVRFRHLEERGDPRATEAISRAIELETNPTRRNEWLEELLRLSEGETARALARTHLERVLAAPEIDLSTLLSFARLTQRYRFWNLSETALKRAKLASPDPEASVEIDALLALALEEQGKGKEAATLLDALLKRLSADHWRRREVLVLRLGVIANDEQRKAYLKSLEEAWRAKPGEERGAVDYAEALIASDRRDEAAKVLVEASAGLPKSHLLESRALELLESSADSEAYAAYLSERLERQPDRSDLRFRLVKAQYSFGKDAAAAQDFQVVVAGLPPDQVSERILELQRYLRGMGRSDAAVPYLERYLKSHPARLDVARELAEIRLEAGKGDSLGEMVRGLQPADATTENVLDFAEFLAEAGHFQPARSVVEAKLSAEPRQFDLLLELIEILGRSGDGAAAGARIEETRELADTAPRYAKWIKSSVAAHRHLETLPGFFEREMNSYRFDEGMWPEAKVERFLTLCEAGRRQMFAPRIAEGLRQQLAQPGLSPSLKLRLRNVLAAVLESDPASASELEEQLVALSAEDPAHRADHDLRRALVYHRSQRIDLARGLLLQIDPADVGSAALLREAAEVFIEYGLFSQADTSLETVVRLEPEDLLSRERRLTVLAALGKESILRTAIRGMRDEASGIGLRPGSRRALDAHLESSYWRSIASLLETDDLAEALPLLASVEQGSLGERTRLWTEWTRARVLARIGRIPEARETLDRFLDRGAKGKKEVVSFPDGMELSLAGAAKMDGDRDGEKKAAPATTPTANFLLSSPVHRWSFELPEQRQVVRFASTEGRVLVLDEENWVHGLDGVTGKLLWTRAYGDPKATRGAGRPSAFDDVGLPLPLARKLQAGPSTTKRASDFVVSGDRFLLVEDGVCLACSIEDGTTLWSFALDEGEEAPGNGRARPEPSLAVSAGRVVVFDPLNGRLCGIELGTGKLLWATSVADPGLAEEEDELFSLNAGLDLTDDLGIAYGWRTVIFDPANGEVVWRFAASASPEFPVTLRPQREGDEELAVVEARGSALFDFRARQGAGAMLPQAFLKSPARLAGPAVFWNESRLRLLLPSAAALGGDAAWLMQDGKVRRISCDLPVASRELPAGGTFVGQVGEHLWFLDQNEILHADFRRGRTTRLALGETVGRGDLRATLIGNQVVVRDRTSLVVLNALTGEVIGRATLPADLIAHLATALPAVDAGASQPSYYWQGRASSGTPARSLPVGDVFAGKRCYTLFADRVLACLEPSPPPRAPAAPPQ